MAAPESVQLLKGYKEAERIWKVWHRVAGAEVEALKLAEASNPERKHVRRLHEVQKAQCGSETGEPGAAASVFLVDLLPPL